MGPGVRAHLVAFVHHALERGLIAFNVLAQHKEGGARAVGLQGVQYPLAARLGAVVKSQGQHGLVGVNAPQQGVLPCRVGRGGRGGGGHFLGRQPVFKVQVFLHHVAFLAIGGFDLAKLLPVIQHLHPGLAVVAPQGGGILVRLFAQVQGAALHGGIIFLAGNSLGCRQNKHHQQEEQCFFHTSSVLTPSSYPVAHWVSTKGKRCFQIVFQPVSMHLGKDVPKRTLSTVVYRLKILPTGDDREQVAFQAPLKRTAGWCEAAEGRSVSTSLEPQAEIAVGRAGCPPLQGQAMHVALSCPWTEN